MNASRIFIALLLCGCGETRNERPADPDRAAGIARGAAQAALQALSAELATVIADGGAASAIPVCSETAGPVIQQIAAERGVEMIRLSDKPRNPARRAEGTDAAAIETFRTLSSGDRSLEPLVEISADGSATVRLPIFVSAPLCLQCHGSEEDISSETRAAILAVYPEDEATGYRIGDLRGIWRVKVPAAAAP